MFLTPLCLPPQEDCSVQSVWTTGGLSILTSVPLVPQYACLLCASKGQHEVHPDCSSLQHSLKHVRPTKKIMEMTINFRFSEMFIIIWKFYWCCLSNINLDFFFHHDNLMLCRCCIVKSAVSLSIASAWTLQSALWRRTRRTGAVVTASSAEFVDSRIKNPR